jgi:hypothetical protein
MLPTRTRYERGSCDPVPATVVNVCEESEALVRDCIAPRQWSPSCFSTSRMKDRSPGDVRLE